MPFCRIYNTFGDELRRFTTNDFGSSFTIGRSSHCQVSLKNFAEANVSREHLLIQKSGGSWEIVNKGHSGMYLNGQKIGKAPLVDGAVFRFSQLFLCIGEKNGPSQYELTWEAETENNQHRGILWPGINTVGASRDNYVTIRTDDISRIHAKITVNENKLFYENISMGRESNVNGIAVGDSVVELKEEDVITIGETPVRVAKGLRFRAGAMTSAVSPVSSKVREAAKHPVAWLIAAMVVVLLGLLLFILFAQVIWELLLA